MHEYTIPSLDGGICLSDLAYKLSDSQASNMNNMWFNDKVLNKRWGQGTAVNSLNGAVRAWYEETFQGYGIFHAGTNIYKYDITNDTATSIKGSISNTGGAFFNYGDNLYYMDGSNYWVINSGLAVSAVTPYVPVVLTGCTPTMSNSTAYEDYNMIGAGFTCWYTADATNTYSLPNPVSNVGYTESGTNYQYKLYGGTKSAVCFTAVTNNVAGDSVKTMVKLIKGAVGATNLTLEYYTDVTNAPGVAITNALEINVATISNSAFADYTYHIELTNSMTNGTKYWLVATGANGSATNYFEWKHYNDKGTTNIYSSYYTPSTWTPQTNYTAYFRVGQPTLKLDATTPIVSINNSPEIDITYDRVNYSVVFATAPANDGVQNGVRITAYSTDATAAAKIKGCDIATLYGGDASSTAGGTRVFVSGNATYPTTYWRSGLKDPTYFPENQYDLLDNNNQAITKFGKQYGKLIAFKSKSIYSIDYSFDGTNVLWPTKEVHASVGCDMPGSVQLVDNRLVFFNSYQGGFILDRIDQTSENNVKPISNNINGTKVNAGLLAESLTNLQACKSIDFGRKYWLNLPNGKCWLWDYDISPYYDNGDYSASQRRLKWFPFTNIYAGAWFANNQTLYYGRSDEGSVTKFADTFLDYGAAISCYWQSKAFDFDLPQYWKTVHEVIMGLRSDTNTSVTIEYFDEKKEKTDSKTITVGTFLWASSTWETWTWKFYRYAQMIRRRPKRKKIVYFSIKVSNAQASRDLGITDLCIIFEKNRRVK